MKGLLLHSLLELAHSTSQNLDFAHREDVHVSYGEETITETNLLELRRRHPAIITLRTFGKKKESLNGADWEWHIIGRHRKLRMRVQAKRLQKNNILKIPHEVKSSGAEQVDLLIERSRSDKMCPVYCIYSAERQRKYWAAKPTTKVLGGFEYGCLIASAHFVKSIMPKSLSEIEAHCIPWHYLVERREYACMKIANVESVDDAVQRFSIASEGLILGVDDERATDRGTVQRFPTLDELNATLRPTREIEGLSEAYEPEYVRQRSDGEYRERGIARLVEIDVREFPAPKDAETDIA